MKSEMPYVGVRAPEVRDVCREVFASYPFADAQSWRTDVLSMWRSARHREERYAAIALGGHRKARAFRTIEALSMYEEIIVTGAWWDYVDDVAEHQVGELLRHYPGPMRRAMLAWSRSTDIWKRRTAIICQMRFGDLTDLTLLYACIEPSLACKEFFLRKAIGWALRQVAWRDPDEVVRYVQEHDAELSPLSRREALKNVARLKAGTAKLRRPV